LDSINIIHSKNKVDTIRWIPLVNLKTFFMFGISDKNRMI